jgi:hypothetical protein
MWMIQSVMLGRTCWAEKATNERHRCEPSARSLSRQRRRPVWRAAQFLLLGERGPRAHRGALGFRAIRLSRQSFAVLIQGKTICSPIPILPRPLLHRPPRRLSDRRRPTGGRRDSPTETVAEVLSLLQRPVPDSAAFDRAVSRLLDHPVPEEIPASATPFEYELFDVLTILFLAPLASGRAREAIRAAVGETNFEYLIAYLAFIRAAHYWTETHPN